MKNLSKTKAELLAQEKQALESNDIMFVHANVCKACHLWNINHFELFQADGFSSFKAFVIANKANYDTVKSMLKLANKIIECIYPDASQDEIYLTDNDAKKFVMARKRALQSEKSIPLALPEHVSVNDSDEDVSKIADTIKRDSAEAKGKRKGMKYKKARDMRLTKTEIAEKHKAFIDCLVSAARQCQNHYYSRKSDMTREQRSQVIYYTRLIEMMSMSHIEGKDDIHIFVSYENAIACEDINVLRERNPLAAEAIAPQSLMD